MSVEAELQTNIVHVGDALAVCATLPACCVDALVTDPPVEINLLQMGFDCGGRVQWVALLAGITAEVIYILYQRALEGSILPNALSAAQMGLTVAKFICFNFKRFLAYGTDDGDAFTPIGIAALIRAEEITRFRDLYSPRLLPAKLATLRTRNQYGLPFSFICFVTGTRAINWHAISTQKWLPTINAVSRVFLNSFCPYSLEDFIFPIFPFKLRCTGDRAAFIAFYFHWLPTHFTRIFRGFRDKHGRCMRHRQLTMERLIEKLIWQFYPIVFGPPDMAIVTAGHKITHDVRFIEVKPESLRDEVVGNKISRSSTVNTNCIASYYGRRDFFPTSPFIRPLATTPSRVALAGKPVPVISCHADPRAIDRVWIPLGNKTREFGPTCSTYEDRRTTLEFRAPSTPKQSGLNSSATFARAVFPGSRPGMEAGMAVLTNFGKHKPIIQQLMSKCEVFAYKPIMRIVINVWRERPMLASALLMLLRMWDDKEGIEKSIDLM